MASRLPGDITYLIVGILGEDRDFNSLFQYHTSSRLSEAAGLNLPSWTRHILDENGPLCGALLCFLLLIKPIFRTTVTSGIWISTIYRISSAIVRSPGRSKSMSWRGLRELYLTRCSEFFTPELRDLVSQDYELKGSKRLRSLRTLPDSDWILSKIGAELPRYAECPATNLTIWSGVSLTDHAGDKIRTHCPEFRQITIYRWIDEQGRNSETDAEEFLHGLQPHSLEYFEILSSCQLGPRSIRAVGTQLRSLKELKLTSLGIEAIAELPSLTAPPVLEVLVLTDSIPAPRNEDFHSTVSRVADWIGTCKALQHLELRRFVDDTYLLARILVAEDFKLLSLSLTGYTMVGSRHFHRALGSQDSLLRLSLRGEGSEIPEDNELLVQAICQLHNLHELELKDISDYFTPDHLMSLTPHLPHLEKLWIGGDLFNDDVWNAFLCLPKLRSLAIHALSEFTAQGILDFIAQLGPGNTGMSLMILNSITSLTEEAQSLIRDILKHNLDGTFDFGLAQGELRISA
ncbi:conserved hypothetical protein [Aspergillus fumigatus Af293]|uniref:F-box domain-containing protein n=1 Tax=Aspergillus fumigatus (strain ATCC MYA-4609 / CBS 101355 / FGSC A1100 / Af293) TaxID=330879 RepID=Q4X198_ASPFU|nr:conserved hypothetical protein [Aspergillus fumigatus Af293]EAL93367.1 conserved hypothetical protein [Aspergillus fumigatus Af293]